MADQTVDLENKSAKELLALGIKSYIIQDFNAAVQTLSKASEMLAAEHGDRHESLGEAYLYYGKALLGLARDETDALGDAVPNQAEDEEEEEVEEAEEANENEGEKTEQEAGKSSENGEASTSGAEPDPGAEANADEEDVEDEPTDLQLAWEVLELAKTIFESQGEAGRKHLAETLITLGEISQESDNFDAAVADIKQGVELQKQLFGTDSRTVAESLFKLGIAHSTTQGIEEAIQSFEQSLEYLKNRINVLEQSEDKKDSVEDEMKEIKGLMPEIEEKIADLKSHKEEDKCCDGVSLSILNRFECLRVHINLPE